MDDYNRGKRDIMLEMARADLVDVASRIAVLESDLDGARQTKWDLVRKISLLESDAAFECLDSGEKLSLHDKIEHIKKNAFLSCHVDLDLILYKLMIERNPNERNL